MNMFCTGPPSLDIDLGLGSLGVTGAVASANLGWYFITDQIL